MATGRMWTGSNIFKVGFISDPYPMGLIFGDPDPYPRVHIGSGSHAGPSNNKPKNFKTKYHVSQIKEKLPTYKDYSK